MTRLRAVGFFLAFALLSLGAAAVTIQPLPGSAPQTTRAYAYFPETIGVVVRDDAGVPLAGVDVAFTFDMSNADAPYLVFMDGTGAIVTTNSEGIATIAVAAGHIFGGVDLLAYYADETPIAMRLFIQGAPAVELRPISGDAQVVEAMQAFAQPWVVRALDAAGKPVPNAVVMFDGQSDAGQPGGIFDGQDTVAVRADASGYARSPLPRANDVLGDGIAYVCGFDMGCPTFHFKVVPPPSTAASIRPLPGSTPQTTCNSCVFANPIGVIVRDHLGQPMAGVKVTFSIPDADALSAFDFAAGSTSRLITMETNADGIAAPLFIAFGKDKATVTATTPIALGDAVFNLKIKERGLTRFEILSGDGQSAPIFSTYAQPWSVRALDRHGRPVAGAVVLFGIDDRDGYPGGRFGDRAVVIVAADGAGVATAPRVTANGVVGENIGSALSFVGDTFVQFHFRNLAP